MRCLIKIPRRYLICLSLSVVFSFCLSVFGFVSDSYATSGTCTWSFTKDSNSAPRGYFYGSTDNFCTAISSSTFYVRVKSYTLTFTEAYTPSVNHGFTLSSSYSDSIYRFLTFNVDFNVNSPNYPITVTNDNVVSTIKYNFRILNNSPVVFSSWYVYYESVNNVRGSGSVVFEYTDNLSDWFSDSEPCPEVTPCPPIPENPYDNKLDDIKKAIYTSSAVMIMIYFFFIVYKIIVKDGGRR